MLVRRVSWRNDVAVFDPEDRRKSADRDALEHRDHGLEGGDRLEHVTWRDKNTGAESTQDIRHVFMMTGASPRTNGCMAVWRSTKRDSF